MSTLETLIKINRQKLDDLRRDLKIYLDKKDELTTKIIKLDEELKKEMRNLENFPEARYIYANYAAANAMNKENTTRIISKLDSEIAKLSDEIIDIFSEVKKFEIIKNRNDQRLLKEFLKKEQSILDELAILSANIN